MESCLRCHGQQGGVVECDTCHQGRRAEERLVSGSWAVTHGPQWQKTHGMGDMYTCAACHARGSCDKCHGVGLPHDSKLRVEHPALARDSRAKCASCHQPAFCSGCHGVQMPHPADFKQQHGSIAVQRGREVCQSCHVQTDCDRCHIMHIHPGGAGALGVIPSSLSPGVKR